MTIPTLLAVLEVDHADRVRCQAPGCGKPVYRRIHVVQADGALQVLGEDCCGRLFGWDKTRPTPRVAVPEGRRLTKAERDQLVANTELLLKNLSDEVEQQRLQAREKLQRLKSMLPQPAAPGKSPPARRALFAPPPPPTPEVLALALRRMDERWQLDSRQAQSPGWASLLRDVIAEIERETS